MVLGVCCGMVCDSAVFILFTISNRLFYCQKHEKKRKGKLGQLFLAAMENSETRAATARNISLLVGIDSPVYSDLLTSVNMV